MIPIDNDIRIQAMDPYVSAIVSAPAGSGKTYLLTRRILNLLMHSDEISDVVAITFTKKAAGEMRERLIHCLENPEEDCAKAVLARSDERGWNILNQTSKLNIMTIDSFCSWLLSHATPTAVYPVTPSPQSLYIKAITYYFSQEKWRDSQTALLSALNGKYNRLEQLLTHLLGIRDQWQDCIEDRIDQTSAIGLEALKQIHIETCQTAFEGHHDSIHALIDSLNSNALFFTQAPLFELESEKATWQALAQVLLTKSNSIRRKQNKAQGIYPKSLILQHPNQLETQQQAQRTIDVLAEALHTDANMLEALASIQNLPSPQSSEEIVFLKHLTDTLSQLSNALSVVFDETQTQDFSATAAQAIAALQADSKLAQHCKQSLKHLLMDEFQDTSQSQYTLASHIIHHWDPNNHHTFFAVGDPMQSIYRFRQADVRLFIQAQSKPIGHIKTIPLYLACNFRSSTTIIEAINDHFSCIFPPQDDLLKAAIKYRPATPTQPSPEHAGIYLQHEQNDQPEALAKRVLDIIEQLQNKHPDDRIAILAQTRSHLKHIIPALEQAGKTFNAIDIYPMGTLSAISDLSCLIGYLYQSNDSIAYYSLLRSPLCGLSLQDIEAHKQQKELSPNGYTLLGRLHQALQHAHQLTPLDITQQCWQVWQLLRGFALYPSKQHAAIYRWFDEIQQLRANNLPLHRHQLQSHFASTFMSLTDQSSQLFLLTSHKSKGLEYEHVIIPHAEKRKMPADLPLFYVEQAQAPIMQPTFISPNSNNDYFKNLNSNRDQDESLRLLYVAATRAKYTLHLVAHYEDTPPSKSWMEAMLKNPDARHTTLVSAHTEAMRQSTEIKTQRCYAEFALDITKAPHKPAPSFEATATDQGISLHFLMEHIKCPKLEKRWQQHLLIQGYSASEQAILNQHRKTIELTLTNSDIAKWILGEHLTAYNEISFDASAFNAGHIIMDRLIVDTKTIWLIDYKFHEAKHDERTLQRLHTQQLKLYHDVLKVNYPNHEIRTGLYLPLFDQWLEITHPHESVSRTPQVHEPA